MAFQGFQGMSEISGRFKAFQRGSEGFPKVLGGFIDFQVRFKEFKGGLVVF